MKRKRFKYPPAGAEPLVLKESGKALGETELVINVRAAKDQLSSLLEQAAQGNEIIITSDGLPKAKLGPVRPKRRLFRVDWKHLHSMPSPGVVSRSEDLVREDRDTRP